MGDWIDIISDQLGLNGNISLDPMFCDTANDDYTIKDISPCAAENNSCGTLIGARGVGCIDERPEISSLSALEVFEDSTLIYNAEFTDADGPDTVVTYEYIPSWMTANEMELSGVPTEGVVDTSFTLIVSDGYKADTQVVTIDVIPVNDAPTLAEMEDQNYYEGSHYELLVNAFDIDGPVLELTTSTLPPNASFYDSTNGAGLFTFDPDIDQAGVTSVYFIASDGEYADSQRVKFTVLESDIQIASLKIDNLVNPQHLTNHTPLFTWSYTDPLDLKAQSQCEIEVGEDDDWTYAELWNPEIFSSTDTFAVYAGAPLFDGVTYYLRLRLYNNSVWSHWIEADFHMNSVPTVPSLSWPPYNAVIDNNQPVVYVRNATDAENDSLEYDYEVFTDSSYGNVELHMGFYVEEGRDSTGWLVDAILYENWKYWWRARSYDGYERSDWTAIAPFWINVNEEAPGIFELVSPDTSLGIVYDMLPDITWTSSSDPDPLDSVYYKASIAIDAGFVFKWDIDSIWDVSHTLTDSLDFGTQYWWKVRAVDNTGLYANSSNIMTFKTWKLGDATGDWQVNLLDILFLIDNLYGGGEPPNPGYTGDVNGDCDVNLIDVLYLIGYLYNFPAGPAPVAGCE